MRRVSTICLLTFSLLGKAAAQEAFRVEDIEVRGLQRVPVGTVLNYLPVQVGSELDSRQVAEAIRTLYDTGFFQDVALSREGDLLIVELVERPSIAELDIEGNKALDTDQLIAALADFGLGEGEVFNRFLLNDVERELRSQYLARGQYDVQVESTVTPVSDNRVAIRIDIDEGEPASIREVTIVGNEAFSDDDLRKLFELGPKRWYHFFSDRDQYSRERLTADLERLRSFYQDRGYLNFEITSTQVALSPQRDSVYVTVNLSEGEQYEVGEVSLVGDLIVPEDELKPLIRTESGELYSRGKLVASVNAIRERLGQEGFAFANVNAVPEVDEDAKRVDLTYFVDPAQRVYVRRINISGNESTRDDVIRRELRQLEGSWLSTSAVRRSRQRLERTGFFEQVNIETPRVPGEPDMVDVDVSVVERLSGSLQAGIGYGEGQGMLINFSVEQNNFLGSGDRLFVAFNNSDVNTIYSISHVDRYYTDAGISRTLNATYKETDAREADLADYGFTTGSLGVSYGIPISEDDTFQFGLSYEQLDIELGYFPRLDLEQAVEEGREPYGRIPRFINEHGDDFQNYKASIGWVNDTRNSPYFPSRGARQRIGGEVALPGSDLEYYKLTYSHSRYFPLTSRLTFAVDFSLGYGDGYGDTDYLPFFENFYAGGISTVRGFDSNSLGPREILVTPSGDRIEGDPLGGNARILGSAALVFPIPFTEINSVRLSTFLDAGNVFDTRLDPDYGDLRYSTGIGLVWMSPLGALTMSLARPLNDEEDDDTQTFQFSLGSFF